MPPSCFISWISTTFAAGDATPTSVASVAEVSRMNAPVAFCPATVPRTQASLTATWANEGAADARAKAAMISGGIRVDGIAISVAFRSDR